MLIFDSSQGYPAPCLGNHNVETDDPVRVTGNPAAVAMPGAGFEGIPKRYLSLSAAPPGGAVVVDSAGQADDVARNGLAGSGILALTVIAGALNHIVRQHTTGLSPPEQEALDLIAAALPDVATLRALLDRGGLARDLAAARTVLETLAAS